MEKLSQGEFLERLRERNSHYADGEFEVLGEYAGISAPLRCRCLVCGNVWDGNPDSMTVPILPLLRDAFDAARTPAVSTSATVWPTIAPKRLRMSCSVKLWLPLAMSSPFVPCAKG